MSRLKVTETFVSIQGEADAVGWPTLFIRLTGCPLRCKYCDTQYSFYGGEWRTLDELLDIARDSRVRHVCVTGGEPLAQKACLPLLAALCDAGYSVSLETSGALDISGVDPRVSRVMDLKAPASGEADRNHWENLALLNARDELKIVLAGEADYAWAKSVLAARRLDALCPVLLSPVAGKLDAKQLAEWVLRDQLPVRVQLQLHKLIWGLERGR